MKCMMTPPYFSVQEAIIALKSFFAVLNFLTIALKSLIFGMKINIWKTFARNVTKDKTLISILIYKKNLDK